MIQCEACGRHLRAQEKGCPFCRKPRTRNIAVAMSAVLTPVVLAACYGAPDKWYEDTGDTADTGNAGLTVDLDEDGWDTRMSDDDGSILIRARDHSFSRRIFIQQMRCNQCYGHGNLYAVKEAIKQFYEGDPEKRENEEIIRRYEAGESFSEEEEEALEEALEAAGYGDDAYFGSEEWENSFSGPTSEMGGSIGGLCGVCKGLGYKEVYICRVCNTISAEKAWHSMLDCVNHLNTKLNRICCEHGKNRWRLDGVKWVNDDDCPDGCSVGYGY